MTFIHQRGVKGVKILATSQEGGGYGVSVRALTGLEAAFATVPFGEWSQPVLEVVIFVEVVLECGRNRGDDTETVGFFVVKMVKIEGGDVVPV
jgi:hypothetical protein